MPRKIGSVTRDILVNAALPAATKTYTVISHSYAINTILKALSDNGFSVDSEEYKCTLDARVATGTFIIHYDADPDLNLIYSFTNSYDKSLRFKAAVGAQIIDNGAFMIGENNSWIRKHTGTADNETEELINDHIENAKTYFDNLVIHKLAMEAIDIDRSVFGAVIGELFMSNFLAIDQISMIGKEFEAHQAGVTIDSINLWASYKIIANALRQSHPSRWMGNQIGIHLFFMTKFNLVQFDDEAIDPNIENENGNDTAPVIPGILEGVKEFPILPGFESVAEESIQKEESPVEEDFTGQKTIEEAIDEAEQKGADFDIDAPVDEIKKIEPETSHVDEVDAEAQVELEAEHQAEVEASVEAAMPEGIAQEAADKSDEVPIVSVELDGIKVEVALDPAVDTPVEYQNGGEDAQPIDALDASKHPQHIAVETTAGEPTHCASHDAASVEEIEKEESPFKDNADISADVIDYLYIPYDEALEIGDVVEQEDGTFVMTQEIEEIEGDKFFKSVVVEMGGEKAEEEVPVKKEPVVTVGEPMEPDEPNAEGFVAEEEEAVTEEATEEIPDIMPEPTVDVPTEDPIRKIIGKELEELYDYTPEFTFDLIDDQYNVKLDTGETIVLAAGYIKGML